MDLRALTLFLDVAELRSFAAVARLRAVEPSSVSRAVAALEGTLGARLFHRTTRAMALTDAGELLLARAPALVRELDRLGEEVASARADPVGPVRMTASVAYGVRVITPLLPEFRARFPRLRLEVILSDANVDLIAERIDLAIRLAPAARGDLEAIRLAPTRYRVVASPEYIARAGPLVRAAELSERDCLVFALPDYRRRWLVRGPDGAEEAVNIHSSLVISSALALREAALADLGPALLADWLIGSDLRSGALVDLLPGHRVTATSFDTAVWLLHPSQEFIPRRIRSVIAFLRQRIGGVKSP